MNKGAVKLTVYSRANCHLCEDMIAGLRELQAAVPFVIEVVDVTSVLALEVRYGKRVPVLVAADTELCHYHLDLAKVNEFLRKFS